MGVIYTPGQVLTRGDLDLYLTNSDNHPANAFSITYAIYYVDPDTSSEVLVGPSSRDPVNPAVGEYYVAIQIPSSAVVGDYRVRWTLQETSGSQTYTVVQEFGVVSPGTDTGASVLSACEAELIYRLRIMLRDNNPDKNYRFRPPEHEGKVGCYNQVFGYIWTDEELLEYLKITLDKWNMQPPKTEHLCSLNAVCKQEPSTRAALLWGAVVHAAMALSFNMIVEEFSTAGDTMVQVLLPDGSPTSMRIADLYDICYGGDV
jgi:hypothetical protein